MASQDDLLVEKLLDKTTIDTLLKNVLGQIYGVNEVQQMECGLKNALSKYDKEKSLQEELHVNEEDQAEPCLEDCLNVVCGKNLHHGKGHTPESLLLLAKFFIKIGDYRIGCEVLWGFASLLIQKFIKKHNLRVELLSHVSKRRFAWALSDDIGRRFHVFLSYHDSFYANGHNARDMNIALRKAKELVHQLDELVISEEKRMELETESFY